MFYKILVISMNGRRGRLDIISEILDTSRNGARKVQIMYKVNMSSKQANDYLPFLTKKNFLRENGNGGKPIYETTDKGRRFIELHGEVKGYLA